ncbi:MAG TPA: NAD(P)-binding domain-containing protein [Acidimicrobiales bacterium]|nr:NAD(P)-binding domain-containing protein [Acidimicrobiales bacterium]
MSSSPAAAAPFPGPVGVAGLGAIGGGVAGALVRAGADVRLYDVRPEAAATFAGSATAVASPAELGAASRVVVVAVVDDAQVRAVLSGPDGVLGAMEPGGAVLILSTVTVPTVLDVAAEAERQGVAVLDCGVTGGPAAAASGELVALVGGAEADVALVRPVLDAFSVLVMHMGGLGAGLQAKLARNIVTYGAWLAAWEGQRLAEAAGIELSKLAEAIRTSEKRTGGTTALMFRDTVAPWPADADAGIVTAMRNGATLAHKDLRAAMELGRTLGIELPVAALTEGSCDAMFGFAPAAGSDEDGERP